MMRGSAGKCGEVSNPHARTVSVAIAIRDTFLEGPGNVPAGPRESPHADTYPWADETGLAGADRAVSPLRPGIPHQPIADGAHAGCRWWAERVPGLAHPLVTVSGWLDGVYVFRQLEMQAASAARVRAWIDQLLAEPKGRRAGRAT